MTKILKSILIATASLGSIAGSTAAVVSCGEESNNHYTPGTDFNSRINKLSLDLGIFFNSDITDDKKLTVPYNSTNFTSLANDFLHQKAASILNEYTDVVDVDNSKVKQVDDFDVTSLTPTVEQKAKLEFHIYPKNLFDEPKIIFINLTIKLSATPDQITFSNEMAGIHTALETNVFLKNTPAGETPTQPASSFIMGLPLLKNFKDFTTVEAYNFINKLWTLPAFQSLPRTKIDFTAWDPTDPKVVGSISFISDEKIFQANALDSPKIFSTKTINVYFKSIRISDQIINKTLTFDNLFVDPR